MRKIRGIVVVLFVSAAVAFAARGHSRVEATFGGFAPADSAAIGRWVRKNVSETVRLAQPVNHYLTETRAESLAYRSVAPQGSFWLHHRPYASGQSEHYGFVKFYDAANTIRGIAFTDPSTGNIISGETDPLYSAWLDTFQVPNNETDPIYSAWADTFQVPNNETDPLYSAWVDTFVVSNNETDPVYAAWVDTFQVPNNETDPVYSAWVDTFSVPNNETDPVFYDWYWNTFLPHITIDASTSTIGIMDILPTATLDVGGTKTDAGLEVHDTQLLRWKYGPSGYNVAGAPIVLRYDDTKTLNWGFTHSSFLIAFKARDDNNAALDELWHFGVQPTYGGTWAYTATRVAGTNRVRMYEVTKTTTDLRVEWILSHVDTEKRFDDSVEITVMEIAAGHSSLMHHGDFSAVGIAEASGGTLVEVGNAVVPSTASYVLGDSSTNTSWRWTRDGNAVDWQRRESSVWNEKMSLDETGNLTLQGRVAIPLDSAYYIGDPETNLTQRIVSDGGKFKIQEREDGEWVTKWTSDPGMPAYPSNIQLQEVPYGTMTALQITWDAVTGENVGADADSIRYYTAYIREDGESTPYEECSTWEGRTTALVPQIRIGDKIYVSVVAMNNKMVNSDVSPEVSITITGDAIAPGDPTNLTVSPQLYANFVQWTNPTDTDLAWIEVWRDIAEGAGPGSATGDTAMVATTYHHRIKSYTDYVGYGGEERWYWIRAIDENNNKSAWVGPDSATTLAASNDDIQDAAIDSSKIRERSISSVHVYNLVADSITSGNLTALNIQTAKSGDRIQLNSDGLRLFKDIGESNKAVFTADLTGSNVGKTTIGDTTDSDGGWLQYDPTTGKLTLRGTIAQSLSGTSQPVPVWRQAWAVETTYYQGDLVIHDGSTYLYIAPTASSNHEPPNATYWSLFTSQGDTGAAGEQGPQGETGAVGPGIVYRGEFHADTTYYNTSERRDVVYYPPDEAYFIYNSTTDSGAWNPVNWESFGATFSSVATELLLAKDATILHTLVMGDGTADKGIIRSASKDTYADTDAGFWLGYDGTTPKFVIGDADEYMQWTGDSLVVKGRLDASDLTIGTIAIDRIGDGTITGAKIAESTIDTTHIEIGVLRPRLINEGLLSDALFRDSVIVALDERFDALKAMLAANDGLDSASIGQGVITDWHMPDSTITPRVIGRLSIERPHIAEGAVGRINIASAAIDSALIDVAALDSVHFRENSIRRSHIAAAAIDSAQIAIDAVRGEIIAAGAITGPKVAAGAIGRINIASAAIDSALIDVAALDSVHFRENAIRRSHIAAAAIDSAQLAIDAVRGEIIADGAITGPKVAAGAIDSLNIALSAIRGELIATQGITETHIADNAITTPKLVANAVTADKITAGSIGTIHFTTDSAIVGSAQIVEASIGTAHVDSISAAKLTAGSIVTDKIAAGAITGITLATEEAVITVGAQIADAVITTAHIDSLDATVLEAGTIQADKIGAAAVTADKILAGSIGTHHFTADSAIVGSAQIVEASIGTAHIDSISAAKLNAGTIVADKIAAGAITAPALATEEAVITVGAQIADAVITTAHIDSLDATVLEAGTIQADKIGAAAITAEKILAGSIGTHHFTSDSAIIGSAMIVSLDADLITSGLISSERLDADSITTGTLEGVHIAAVDYSTGARVDLMPEDELAYGLRVLDRDGNHALRVVTGDTTGRYAGDIMIGSFDGDPQSGILWDADEQTLYVVGNVVITDGITHDSIVTADSLASVAVDSADAAYTLAGTAYSNAGTAYALADAASDSVGSINASIRSTQDWTKIDGGNIYTGSITADALDVGSVTADAIGAGEISAIHFYADSAIISDANIINLDAAKLTTGTLDADRIAAHTITAGKLILASPEIIEGTWISNRETGNVTWEDVVIDYNGQSYEVRDGAVVSLTNASFEDGLTGWGTFTGDGNVTTRAASEASAYTGTYGYEHDCDSNSNGAIGIYKNIASLLEPSTTYTVSVWIYRTRSDHATYGPAMQVYDHTNSVDILSRQYPTANDEWQLLSGTFTTEADASTDVRVWLVGNGAAYFDNVSLYHHGATPDSTSSRYITWTMGDSVLADHATAPDLGENDYLVGINDDGRFIPVSSPFRLPAGSVSALHIEDASITSAKISELDAGKITTGTLDAARIATGSLTVSHLSDAGALAYRDSVSVDSVYGLGDLATLDAVELAQLGTTVIDGGYIRTGLIDADSIATGTLTGRTVQTAASGKRVVMDGDSNRVSVFNAFDELQILIDAGSSIQNYDGDVGSMQTRQVAPNDSSTVLVGDVNQDGSIYYDDAGTIFEYLNGFIELTGDSLNAADVYDDGIIDSYDISLIVEYVALRQIVDDTDIGIRVTTSSDTSTLSSNGFTTSRTADGDTVSLYIGTRDRSYLMYGLYSDGNAKNAFNISKRGRVYADSGFVTTIPYWSEDTPTEIPDDTDLNTALPNAPIGWSGFIRGDSNTDNLAFVTKYTTNKWSVLPSPYRVAVVNATNSTLTRSGVGTSLSPYTLGLNLGNANTWTAKQTFSDSIAVTKSVTIGDMLTATDGVITAYASDSEGPSDTILNEKFGTSLPNGFVATYFDDDASLHYLVWRSYSSWRWVASDN